MICARRGRRWAGSTPHWLSPGRPTVAAGYAVLVAVAAAAAIVVTLPTLAGPELGVQLIRTATLGAAALVHAESARDIERMGRGRIRVAHIDLNSAWTFAAALLLPLPLTTLVIAVVYTHMSVRIKRTEPVRRTFNMATVVLASYAASQVMAAAGGPGAAFDRMPGPGATAMLIGALCAYSGVNVLVLAGAIATQGLSRTPIRAALVGATDYALETAALCFGVFVALAVFHQPLLVVFGLPLVLVLHRNVLIRQLQDEARTDSKTGLLNASAWRDQAQRDLTRAQRGPDPLHVMIIDLDRFKKVNDTYGHLAGDAVLRDVAAGLRAKVRAGDAVGRFGGEEFVVVLPASGAAETLAIADRIRRRVATASVRVPGGGHDQVVSGLTVSIGIAQYPTHGRDLDQLVGAADAALYAAKNNGRDQTRLAESRVRPAETG